MNNIEFKIDTIFFKNNDYRIQFNVICDTTPKLYVQLANNTTTIQNKIKIDYENWYNELSIHKICYMDFYINIQNNYNLKIIINNGEKFKVVLSTPLIKIS